ncbi:stressosome-associated protein Prli42 [Radiobacillus kanasensis]|nr:stressosome-associated protein Prli42 [Radiobacillus kanasensis]UFT97704.1 stressosome-associated protein Prli42 [Radiobacillus kanasensis]
MANKKSVTHQNQPRKLSKRERRMKVIIYIMIIAMVLSSLTAGLALFI